jgi:hypothetical protein
MDLPPDDGGPASPEIGPSSWAGLLCFRSTHTENLSWVALDSYDRGDV